MKLVESARTIFRPVPLNSRSFAPPNPEPSLRVVFLHQTFYQLKSDPIFGNYRHCSRSPLFDLPGSQDFSEHCSLYGWIDVSRMEPYATCVYYAGACLRDQGATDCIYAFFHCVRFEKVIAKLSSAAVLKLRGCSARNRSASLFNLF